MMRDFFRRRPILWQVLIALLLAAALTAMVAGRGIGLGLAIWMFTFLQSALFRLWVAISIMACVAAALVLTGLVGWGTGAAFFCLGVVYRLVAGYFSTPEPPRGTGGHRPQRAP